MKCSYCNKDRDYCTCQKTCMKYAGVKHDTNKARYDLIPADALEEVAKAYTYGAKRYGDRNWEKGLKYSRLFGALMRHAWAWWRGERIDKESNLHHLSSVAFCVLGLLHYELNIQKFGELADRELVNHDYKLLSCPCGASVIHKLGDKKVHCVVCGRIVMRGEPRE